MRGRTLFMDPPFDLKRAVDISDVIFKEKRKELVSICDVWRLKKKFLQKSTLFNDQLTTRAVRFYMYASCENVFPLYQRT